MERLSKAKDKNKLKARVVKLIFKNASKALTSILKAFILGADFTSVENLLQMRAA